MTTIDIWWWRFSLNVDTQYIEKREIENLIEDMADSIHELKRAIEKWEYSK